jgi:flagellar motor switch/type III secretory pathway protein FliN
MATLASPQSVPPATSVLLTQNAPRSAVPPAADRVAGTELTTGIGTRLGITASESEFRTLADDHLQNGETDGIRLSAPLERMPVSLGVSIPVRGFRVRTLLAMHTGELIETQWVNGEDLPLASGDLQLAWCEFEVVDTRLAVRVTRLA